MTDEDWQSHRKAKDCHICNKSLMKDTVLDSVSAHNPYTGVYCGQGHRTCLFAEMKKIHRLTARKNKAGNRTKTR